MLVETLTDVQSLPDTRGISLQKVGVRNLEMPLLIVTKNMQKQPVYARLDLSVALSEKEKGTHMSRFVELTNEWCLKGLLSTDLGEFVEEVTKRLNTNEAEVKIQFKYFVEKVAPVSKKVSLMGYDCTFTNIIKGKDHCFQLGVKVPVKTLCPCSKEISKYGAHNQRTLVDLTISYPYDEMIWIEDLIDLCESCGSSSIYPLLKREDEKYVTEKAYENPRFVEDVIRDLILKIKGMDISWYRVNVEALESIHTHNAFAYQEEFISR